MNTTIKKIGVFTSGGDAPGMNAAIRSVVRSGRHKDIEVCGIYDGYQGMISGEIVPMDIRSVANIIHQGGTILRTARSADFHSHDGRKRAYDNLKKHDIDALVAIGGNGTYTGANIFGQEFNIPIIGLPGTIDNDIYGTDSSIGFDTALNTAIEAIDRIRDTAGSHSRIFFIEVMGRHSGNIALHTGIGSGASIIFLPELKGDLSKLIEELKNAEQRGKLFSLIIVAEGDENGGARIIAEKVRKVFPEKNIRETILGHIQRGGSPTVADRVLASRLGYEAIELLIQGRSGIALGVDGNKLTETPFEEAINNNNPLNDGLFKMIEILAI